MAGGPWERGLAAAGALCGFAGVAASAAATHLAATPEAEIAGRFLLVHAAALLAVAAALAAGLLRPAAGRAAGLALAVGVALFSGDLATRGFAGHALFPMAAPTGGTLLLAAWLVLALAALLGPGRRAASSASA